LDAAFANLVRSGIVNESKRALVILEQASRAERDLRDLFDRVREKEWRFYINVTEVAKVVWDVGWQLQESVRKAHEQKRRDGFKFDGFPLEGRGKGASEGEAADQPGWGNAFFRWPINSDYWRTFWHLFSGDPHEGENEGEDPSSGTGEEATSKSLWRWDKG
jgi:hypothetical protein